MSETKPNTFDVAIIGGGIWGSAIAYALAKEHGARVAVVERLTLNAAATSRAAALMPRLRAESELRWMVRETYHAIETLEQSLGDSVGLSRVGSLHVAASPATEESLQAMVAANQGEGDTVTWLDKEEAQARAPWLDLSSGRAFAWVAEDGFIDPYRLGTAFVQAGKQAGVAFFQNTEVTGLMRDKGTATTRVIGLETAAGPINAGTVVDAAGPWASIAASWAGIGLAMAPVRSHYWITAPEERFSRDQAMVFVPDGRFYARPELGGLLFGFRDTRCVGADPRAFPPDMSGFAFGYDDDGWESLAEGCEAFAPFCPDLAERPIAHYVSGASAYTADGKFLLGKLPQVEGFVAATGCSGAGIATAAGVGKAVAALVAGKEPPISLTLFRLDRFGPIEPFDPALWQRCADARANKRAG